MENIINDGIEAFYISDGDLILATHTAHAVLGSVTWKKIGLITDKPEPLDCIIRSLLLAHNFCYQVSYKYDERPLVTPKEIVHGDVL